jgi:hypothetical protein
MKRLPTLSALLLLACSPLLLNAQIYQTIDDDGNVVFTDKPPKGQETKEVKLAPTNTTPAPNSATTRPSSKKDKSSGEPTKYEIRISSPSNETHIPPGQRDVAVSLSLSPGLHKDHQLQLYINGSPSGAAFSGTAGTLKEVYRGTHAITAAVLDKKGKTISTSEPVTIYVQRTIAPRPTPRS